MRTLLLATLLLFPLVSFAQDENRIPDDDDEENSWRIENGSDCTANACNAADCHLRVDELPASPDGELTATDIDANSIRFGFQNPTSNPSEAANAQAFEIVVSKCKTCVENAAGADPNYDIFMACNGTDKETIATNQTVTGLDQTTTWNWTFTADGDCTANGSTVQVKITNHQNGSGGNRRHVCIETLEWEVTHASAAARRLFIASD